MRDTKARLEAIDARTRLHHDLRNGALQLLTVLAVLAGAVVGFQQLAEDRDQARQQLAEDRDKAIQDRQLTRQGQASERFTRAIDQLGSRRVETRIGGIYGLDQIADQSPENIGPVGEVLLAWLNSRPRPDSPPVAQLRVYAPDVNAALSILTGRRYSSIVFRRLNLQGMGLSGAHLPGANLEGANLKGANLRGAHLDHAFLINANLSGANLRGVSLNAASLDGANLHGADLRNTRLMHASIFAGNLKDADLRGADLTFAELRAAHLDGADLRGAIGDKRTLWPKGFDWHRAGLKEWPWP